MLVFGGYLDGARFGVLGFRQVQDQDAVLVVGVHFLSVDRGWQREALLILAGSKAAPVRGCILWHLDVCRPLNSQNILLGRDLYIVGIDTRHGNLEHKAVRCLMQVGCNTTSSNATA